MPPWITIDDLVTFTPQGEVFVHRAALDGTPEKLFNAVKLAFFHIAEDSDVVMNCEVEPLGGFSHITFEEYLRAVQARRVSIAANAAKHAHTNVRRKEFNASRSQLVLAMIESGIPHKCAVTGCQVTDTDELTVDHVVPLSRGGTDELHNLRFLCRSHNSKKGDRNG